MGITKKKDLNFFEQTYIPQIVKGLGLTFKQIFKPKFTRQYPEEKWTPPDSYRGRPVLVQEEDGSERDKERYPVKFEINMVRCIFCGFCEEVCPEEAIIMSDEYELVFSSQDEAIFGKDKLLVPKEKLKKRLDYLQEFR